jgi:hypothetical protein
LGWLHVRFWSLAGILESNHQSQMKTIIISVRDQAALVFFCQGHFRGAMKVQ